MTQTFDVSPVVRPPSIPQIGLTDEHFLVRFWASSHARHLDLEIRDWEKFVTALGVVASVTLTNPILKDDDDGFYNKPPVFERRLNHVFQMGGVNGLVRNTSVIINTRYDDAGGPVMYVWDWEADRLWFWKSPSSTRLIEGPVRVGQRLFFVVVKADPGNDIATLYSSATNLSDVQIHTSFLTGGNDAPPEFMIGTDFFVGIMKSPGNGNPFTAGFAWRVSDPTTTFSVTLTNLTGFGNLQIGTGKRTIPGQVNPVTGEGFLRNLRPYIVTDISETAIIFDPRFSAWGSTNPSIWWHFREATGGVAIRNSFEKSTNHQKPEDGTLVDDAPNTLPLGVYDEDFVQDFISLQYIVRRET